MNAIRVIHPYKYEGIWVFDDPKVGLAQEPFVSGADVIIDCMVADIPNAESGGTILFSAQPFPGHQFAFDWRRQEHGGNWHDSERHGLKGWLCPALFKYFERAPERIYVQVKSQAA
jgi:hypothetical protein